MVGKDVGGLVGAALGIFGAGEGGADGDLDGAGTGGSDGDFVGASTGEFDGCDKIDGEADGVSAGFTKYRETVTRTSFIRLALSVIASPIGTPLYRFSSLENI